MTRPAGDSHLLYVEGSDDEHAIGHLLIQCGFDRHALPDFRVAGGKRKVLAAIPVAVKAGTGQSVGFVLDANNSPQDTWKAVTAQLSNVGIPAPDEIPESGFAGESTTYGARVGVWLMPDNRKTGALEDFLRDLIGEGDPLLPHAEASARRARQLGAQYSDGNSRKAELHTWLAWQREPGRPYGIAIKARYFGVDSVATERFVAWFQRVFGVAEQQ